MTSSVIPWFHFCEFISPAWRPWLKGLQIRSVSNFDLDIFVEDEHFISSISQSGVVPDRKN